MEVPTDLKEVKQKVIKIVELYKKLHPADYKAVVSIVKQKKNNQQSPTASLKGDYVIERALLEYSEVLEEMLIEGLTSEELLITRQGKEGIKFQHWFAKQYPEFSLAEKI